MPTITQITWIFSKQDFPCMICHEKQAEYHYEMKTPALTLCVCPQCAQKTEDEIINSQRDERRKNNGNKKVQNKD